MPDVPAKRKEESLEIECLVHRPAKRKEESLEIITPNSKLSTSFLTVAPHNSNIFFYRATQFKCLLLFSGGGPGLFKSVCENLRVCPISGLGESVPMANRTSLGD